MDFNLHYQPIWDMTHQQVIGYETFVHGVRGESAAELFRRYARQVVLMDRAIIQRAMDEALPMLTSDQQLFLNVHPKSLIAGLRLDLKAINTKQIVLEITEKTPFNQRVLYQLQRLALRGFVFGIDDFGTQFSNLDRLISPTFRPEYLKLDKSFVRGLKLTRNTAVVIRFTQELCQLLHIKLIVEGVETLEQQEYLLAQGVRYMQGYYLGRPAPIAKDQFTIEEVLSKKGV
ncbi:EAL domain-containing protein [Paenibacillus algorifonticola]|uniref:EAL domain-containing protein n=1 Tax=Paenibacillus algorifonticola TaxID=684063 RepID=UPI003D2B53BE